MSREFVPMITADMLNDDGTIIDSIFNNPSLRAQLRAWAAEEMRGLVVGPKPGEPENVTAYADGWNDAAVETLANIERWEKSHAEE